MSAPTGSPGSTQHHRRDRSYRWRLVSGSAAGVLALAALVSGSAWGHVTSKTLDPRLVAWISAGALVVFGILATTPLSKVLAHAVSTTSMPQAGGAVRIISSAVGYLIVIFGVLAVLSVSIEHLLVGAGLAGIVLGIAAQQSLGNVFAGLVLIIAKPFHVGDRIRIRSGSLGGIFDARVREMSLTYVTLHTDDGELKIPNSAMLAAGIGRTPRTPLPAPAGTAVPPAPATAPQAAAAAPVASVRPSPPYVPPPAGARQATLPGDTSADTSADTGAERSGPDGDGEKDRDRE